MIEYQVNGCDFWPDGNYKVCCDLHDIAYTVGGGWFERLAADFDLASCVSALSNPLNAGLMFLGVSLGGWFVFHWKIFNGKNLYELIFRKKYDPTGKL